MSAYVENTSSFKNKIINGALLINQRGSSATVPASTGTLTYVADRFGTMNSVAVTHTMSKNTMLINGLAKPSVKLLLTSGANPTLTGTFYQHGFTYTFEDYDSLQLNGRQITLSFWFNCSQSGLYTVSFRNNVKSYVSSFNGVANTPTKVVITTTLPTDYTSSTPTGSTGFYIQIAASNFGSYDAPTLNSWYSVGSYFSYASATPWMTTNNVSFIEIAQLQLETGDTATDFEYRPYQVELALCQRYCWAMTDAYRLSGGVASATAAWLSISFPVPMRIAPPTPTILAGILEVSDNIVADWASGNPPTLGGYDSQTLGARIQVNNFSGLTPARAILFGRSGTTTTLIFSAEF